MIDVINLEKHFGENKVLNGINVTIDKGDIMVVIGPSGSGKSTFLRCLNCMEDPTGGQIIFPISLNFIKTTFLTRVVKEKKCPSVHQ